MKRASHRVDSQPAFVVLGVALLGLFVPSCSGGGGSSPPQPEGAEAGETAATMGRTSMLGFSTLIELGVPDTPVAPASLDVPTSDTLTAEGFLGRTGVLGLLRRHAAAGSVQAATTDIPCSLAGSLRLICDPLVGGSHAEVQSFGCTEDLGGFQLVVNGSFEVNSDDPDCEDGLDAATEVDVLFNNYTLVTILDGQELGRVRMNGVFSASGETEPVCVDSMGAIGGSYFIQVISGGISSTVTGQGLDIVVQNTAATCENALTVNGTLIMVDGQAGQVLTQTYTDFMVTTTPDGGTGSFVTMDGVASTPCLGDVQFVTVTPLHVAVDGDCPTAGTVDVTVLDTGEISRIEYNPDYSVDIDFMADGSVEITRPTCDDLSSPCS